MGTEEAGRLRATKARAPLLRLEACRDRDRGAHGRLRHTPPQTFQKGSPTDIIALPERGGLLGIFFYTLSGIL